MDFIKGFLGIGGDDEDEEVPIETPAGSAAETAREIVDKVIKTPGLPGAFDAPVRAATDPEVLKLGIDLESKRKKIENFSDPKFQDEGHISNNPELCT